MHVSSLLRPSVRLAAVVATLGLLLVSVPALAQVQAKIDATAGRDTFPLIDTDTLLYVDNRGLDRIFVNLSGNQFRLVANPTEVDRSANAFPIPRRGEITIHVGAFIEPGDGNFVRLASQGRAEADADVVIAPVFVRGQSDVAYQIRRLDPVPVSFDLRAAPNPFRSETTIRYEIPARRISGVEVVIEIYDVLGRRLAVFDEGRRFPGMFERPWRVPSRYASGVYFARIRAGSDQETVRVVHVR
jgi:hypothetical protein